MILCDTKRRCDVGGQRKDQRPVTITKQNREKVISETTAGGGISARAARCNGETTEEKKNYKTTTSNDDKMDGIQRRGKGEGRGG